VYGPARPSRQVKRHLALVLQGTDLLGFANVPIDRCHNMSKPVLGMGGRAAEGGRRAYHIVLRKAARSFFVEPE